MKKRKRVRYDPNPTNHTGLAGLSEEITCIIAEHLRSDAPALVCGVISLGWQSLVTAANEECKWGLKTRDGVIARARVAWEWGWCRRCFRRPNVDCLLTPTILAALKYEHLCAFCASIATHDARNWDARGLARFKWVKFSDMCGLWGPTFTAVSTWARCLSARWRWMTYPQRKSFFSSTLHVVRGIPRNGRWVLVDKGELNTGVKSLFVDEMYHLLELGFDVRPDVVGKAYRAYSPPDFSDIERDARIRKDRHVRTATTGEAGSDAVGRVPGGAGKGVQDGTGGDGAADAARGGGGH